MTPLRIVVDDRKRAKRDAARAVVHPEHLRLFTASSGIIAGVDLWLGVTGLTHHANALVVALRFASSLVFAWNAVFLQRSSVWPVIVPAEFIVGDEGITTHSVSGHRDVLAWRDVRSVENTAHGIVLTTRFAWNRWWTRMMYVPKPADADVVDALWATFYRHLVAPRNLRATPGARLGVIRNTAFV